MWVLYITFFLLHAALFLPKCGEHLFVQLLLVLVVLISEHIHQFFHRLEPTLSILSQLNFLRECFVFQKVRLWRFGSTWVVILKWLMLQFLLLLGMLPTRVILHGPSEVYKFFFLSLFIFNLRCRFLRFTTSTTTFSICILDIGSIFFFLYAYHFLWTVIKVLLELYLQLLYLLRDHLFLTIETSAFFWWILHLVRNAIEYDSFCGSWSLLVMQNVFPCQRTVDSWVSLYVFDGTETAWHWAYSASLLLLLWL